MKITWLGHSAFRIETAKAKILLDPFFTGNPGFSGLDAREAAEGITHILLTHGHGDHVGDTVSLANETGAVVLANADLAGWLGKKGVAKTDMGNTGGTVSFEGFTVTFTQAQHSSAQITEDGISHALGNANGLMLHFDDEPSVLHMGDTDIFTDMSLINELHQPDIGLVPIGDRFTMGGAVAALACQRFFDFKHAIPCHYGSFPIVDQTAEKFVKGMEGTRTRVEAPTPGTTLSF
ncbi:MAG TPA: metal-dependent hydrolase [Pseudorhizobium sp.]|jgi:L-ascorbate metabolism protein UlaG (beta-lactamase superfamily)|nr:metal-dependent hydrolase [Pseudorhizobium sp.]